MPETINSWLARQLKVPEFAKEYHRISQEVDEQLAAVQTARSTLAQKVLETVESERSDGRSSEYKQGYKDAKRDISIALSELFQREGIEVDSTST